MLSLGLSLSREQQCLIPLPVVSVCSGYCYPLAPILLQDPEFPYSPPPVLRFLFGEELRYRKGFSSPHPVEALFSSYL